MLPTSKMTSTRNLVVRNGCIGVRQSDEHRLQMIFRIILILLILEMVHKEKKQNNKAYIVESLGDVDGSKTDDVRKSCEFLESHGINPNKRVTEQMDGFRRLIGISDGAYVAGSFRWHYFEYVSDLDLNETVTVVADKKAEVFETIVTLIGHKIRNLLLVEPKIYFTDFKAGEDPTLRETYWRIYYTITNPDTPVIDMDEIRRLTEQFYSIGRLNDHYRNSILACSNMADALRIYRTVTIYRWKVDSLISKSPTKVIFGDKIVRLIDVIQLEPVVYNHNGKDIMISPPGIPLIKLDVMSFVSGVLTEISYIINIAWKQTSLAGEHAKTVKLSMYDMPYMQAMRFESLRLFNEKQNYIKGFKRVWIFYMKCLMDFKIKSDVRNIIESAIVSLCAGMDKRLLMLERYSAFFEIARNMVLGTSNVSKRYLVEKIPYVQLIENVIYMINKMYMIIRAEPRYLNETSADFIKYLLDTVDNIHGSVNIDVETKHISFNGSEDRFRLYLGTSLSNIRTRSKALIQSYMELSIPPERKDDFLRTFDDIIGRLEM